MARVGVLPRLACKTQSRSIVSSYKAVGSAARSLRMGRSTKRSLWTTVSLFSGAVSFASAQDHNDALKNSPREKSGNDLSTTTQQQPATLGVAMIPHPSKADKGGEDSYFMARHGEGVAFGVFDGVGGWAQLGIDSGEYSRALAAGCKAAYEAGQSDPVKMLQQAYGALHHITGSCTACVLVLEGNQLRSANLGDSGYAVVRDRQIVYRTKEQQHAFNFPYQLGTDSLDTPLDADVHSFTVAPGDFVVVASDGVFDNLFDAEVLAIVCEMRANGAAPPEISKALVDAAFEKGSATTGVDTPFRTGVLKLGYQFDGGKLDDNTCLCIEIGVLAPRTQSKL